MPKKILIVDDEPDIVTFVSTVLEENGYTTIHAKNGVEGLELLRRETPDLVLLDLMMPKKSGISMFQELRADAGVSATPVIVITGVSEEPQVHFRNFAHERPSQAKGASDEGSASEEKHAAPDAYIEKPVSPDLLLKTVQQVLAGR